MNEQQARQFVTARSGSRCEICRNSDPLTFSHRKPKSLGGLWTPSNGLRACGSGTTGCHGFIEANPLWAQVGGWRVGSGQDPAVTLTWVNPVLGWPGWAFLDERGGYEYPDDQPPDPTHLPPQAVPHP